MKFLSGRHPRRLSRITCWMCSLFLLQLGCKRASPPPRPPPVVQILEVVATNVPLSSAEVIGQLDSPQNVEVRARVEGFVEEILFTEGKDVKKDDLLFLLDKKPFIEQLNAAEGMLAEAKAALNKNLKDVARLEPLHEKKAIPKQDLDNAVASVEVGEASVLSAKAGVESAQLNLKYCGVRAPINGLIGAKQVSIGELVGKGEPTLLATISTLDPIWFYCSISEVQYIKAEKESSRTGRKMADLPVSLILADGSLHPHKGKFVFIDRAVDVKTATLRVRAEFPNPEQYLRPGMFARIRADFGTRSNSIVVPERAIAELQGRSFVWVVSTDSKATQRAVKLGEPVEGGMLIEEGIQPGDRIVVEGLQKVREGALVHPMTAAQFVAASGGPASKPAKE